VLNERVMIDLFQQLNQGEILCPPSSTERVFKFSFTTHPFDTEAKQPQRLASDTKAASQFSLCRPPPTEQGALVNAFELPQYTAFAIFSTRWRNHRKDCRPKNCRR